MLALYFLKKPKNPFNLDNIFRKQDLMLMVQDDQKTAYVATNNLRHDLNQRGMYTQVFASDEGVGIEASTNLQWANKQSHVLT